MSATTAVTAVQGWSRRRLVLILGAAAATAVLVFVGLGLAVYYAITGPTTGSEPATAPAYPPGAVPGPARGGAHRDQVAAAPMLAVTPADGRATAPAAVPGPVIVIPPATLAGPASVPAGYPHTPEGAIGQLAAIGTTVLAGMSIAAANDVHSAWALPGAAGVADWAMTRNVRAFLTAAGMGPAKDSGATVLAVPAAGMVKGTDGPDWVLACVLLDVRATIHTEARMGYGYCERMAWTGTRWMIGPGSAPAPAPSTWPGSDRSIKAGWRTWVPAGQV